MAIVSFTHIYRIDLPEDVIQEIREARTHSIAANILMLHAKNVQIFEAFNFVKAIKDNMGHVQVREFKF